MCIRYSTCRKAFLLLTYLKLLINSENIIFQIQRIYENVINLETWTLIGLRLWNIMSTLFFIFKYVSANFNLPTISPRRSIFITISIDVLANKMLHRHIYQACMIAVTRKGSVYKLRKIRNPVRDISFPIFTRKKLKQKELEKKSKQ